MYVYTFNIIVACLGIHASDLFELVQTRHHNALSIYILDSVHPSGSV